MKNIKQNISLERAYNIIKKPITTEKSTNLQQYNQYSFVVSKDSNSSEIKNAIEKILIKEELQKEERLKRREQLRKAIEEEKDRSLQDELFKRLDDFEVNESKKN